MTLPYATATSGAKALEESHKLLRGFGCTQFGSMVDEDLGALLVQFKHQGRTVQIVASFKGYAAAYLRKYPWSDRMRKTRAEHERAAMKQARVSVYSIARDWIKGQITAIEVGMLTFEGAFLGQMLLPSGQTVTEHVVSAGLLPAPESGERVNG